MQIFFIVLFFKYGRRESTLHFARLRTKFSRSMKTLKYSTVIFPQGFFIFILHVLRNGDVRAEFDRKIQKWKISRSIASSRETHQHSSDMWTNKVIICDTYELNSKRNETISRPGSGFDNPLALRQQRSITPVDA